MQIEGKIEERITASKSFEGKITLQRNEYRDLIRLTIMGMHCNYPEPERQSMVDRGLELEEECFRNHTTEEEFRRKINPVIDVSIQIDDGRGTYNNYRAWFRVVPTTS